MANVLSNLAADIYRAAEVVGREQVGAIPSVTLNTDATVRAAKGDTVRSAFTREPVLNTTYAPSMVLPEGTDQTVDNKTLTVNNYASVEIPWQGEEIKHVNNGAGFETIYGNQIARAIRKITNQIESALLVEIKNNSSRAFGTAGTTPFASNFNEVAEIRQILIDNGMPDDRETTLVINTAAGTKLRNLAQLQKVNEAGGDDLLRRGTLLDLQNIMIKESAGVGLHTKGTGTSYQTNNASGIALKDTTIAVDTGSGTIVAGDIITAAADSVNKYVVNSPLSAGSLAIGSPGARVAIPDNNAITVGNNYTANVAFHRTAVELCVRPPQAPIINGQRVDATMDSLVVQDPVTGLVFEVLVYGGHMKAVMIVHCLYGFRVWQSEHVATLLG